MMASFSRPLDNYPLMRTRSIEKVRDSYAQIYARPAITPGNGVKAFSAAVNHLKLQDVGLLYATYGAPVRLEFPESNFFMQLFPIRGNGEIICRKTSVLTTSENSTTIPTDACWQANYDFDYEHLLLKIDARALTKKLASLTGATINKPLRLDLQQSSKGTAAVLLRDYFLYLVDKLSAASPAMPAWALAQHEQLMMTLFLCCHQHNYSHLFGLEAPDAALSQVRRAEEYIEANWQQSITIEDLTEITGVSAFSLFRSFKRHRGYSPLTFASQVRSRRKSRH